MNGQMDAVPPPFPGGRRRSCAILARGAGPHRFIRARVPPQRSPRAGELRLAAQRRRSGSLRRSSPPTAPRPAPCTHPGPVYSPSLRSERLPPGSLPRSAAALLTHVPPTPPPPPRCRRERPPAAPPPPSCSPTGRTPTLPVTTTPRASSTTPSASRPAAPR